MTFHRAFDVVRDQRAALNALIGCRVPRVLTSGGHSAAYHSISELSTLVSESNGRISIMPGSGITEENATTVLQCTGAREIHGSFRCSMETKMSFVHPRVHFQVSVGGGGGGGRGAGIGENGAAVGENNGGGDLRVMWERCVADTEAIRRVKEKLGELASADEEREMG